MHPLQNRSAGRPAAASLRARSLLSSAVALALMTPLAARAQAAPDGGQAAQSATAAQAAQPSPTDLDTVTVTGQRAALARAQALKQDAAGVIDAISAEDVSKFPDQNVADALQRVPGVSVNRSGGESSQVTVRGLGPQFVNVLLNGRSMVSDSNNRSFNFDILPSELIRTLEVQKTSSADTADGGIGGTINILTMRPLESTGFHVAGSASALNDGVGDGHGSNTTPKGSFFISDTNDDHTFGWLLSGVYYKRKHTTEQVTTQGWYVNQDLSALNPQAGNASVPETINANITDAESERKSLNAAIDWKPTDNFTVRLDSMFASYQTDSLQRGMGFYGNAGDITSIDVDGNGTGTGYTRTDTGNMATDYTISPGVRDTRLTQTGLNLAWQIDDSTLLDLDLSTSKAWNKFDNGAGYLVVGTRNVGRTPQWTNPGNGQLPYYDYADLLPTNDPDNLHAHCCGIGGNHLTNTLDEYKLHLAKIFTDSAMTKLDLGLESSDRTYRQISMSQSDELNLCSFYCGYNSAAPAEAIGAYVYDAGSWFSKYSQGFPSQWVSYDPGKYLDYLLTPDSYNQLAGLKTPEQIAAWAAAIQANGGTWNTHLIQRDFNQIQEKNRTFYAKSTFEGMWADMPWYLDAGLRYAKTDTTSVAFVAPLVAITVNPSDPTNAIPTYGDPVPTQAKGRYQYWLPSANFRLNLRDDLVFRLDASKTLTRPELSQLRVSSSYSFRPSNQTVTTGNTALKPYLSKNLDVGLEWYFAEASYVALEGFYKKISNFTTTIDTQSDILGFPFVHTLPVNLNDATVKGLEFTFNYQFTRLPSPLDGLGTAFNYTHVRSDASVDDSIVSGAGRFAIPGIGDSANFSLYYEKGRWQARVAYNWRDEYLSCLSCGVGSLPETTKSYKQIDASASFKVNQAVSLFVEGTNLTRETAEGYMVYRNRPTFVNYDGQLFTFGVRGRW